MAESKEFRSTQLKEVYLRQRGELFQRWADRANSLTTVGYTQKEIESALWNARCPDWKENSRWRGCTATSSKRRLSEGALRCIRSYFANVEDLDVGISDPDRLKIYSPSDRLSYFILRELDLNRNAVLWAEISRTGGQNTCSHELLAMLLIAIEWFGTKVNLVCRTKSYETAYLLLATRKMALEAGELSWESIWRAAKKVERKAIEGRHARKRGETVGVLNLAPLERADFEWFQKSINKFNARFDSKSEWYEFLTSSPISYFWVQSPSAEVAYFSLSERNFVRDTLADSENFHELVRRYELVKQEELFYQSKSEPVWNDEDQFFAKLTHKAKRKGFAFGGA